MEPFLSFRHQVDGRTTVITWPLLARANLRTGVIHVHMIERVPHPGDLEFFVEIDHQIA